MKRGFRIFCGPRPKIIGHSSVTALSLLGSISELAGIPPVVVTIGFTYLMLLPATKLATTVGRRALLAVVVLFWTHSLPAAVVNDLAPLVTRISGPESIPAKLNDRWMFIDVTINGRGPFHMLLDTGCSASVISPAVAAAVDAIPDNAALTVFNGFGTASEMPHVMLDSIQLGRVRFEGVPAGVTSSDEFSMIEGEHIDGMIGFSLFFDVLLSIDFPHQRIEISPEWPKDVAPVRAELAMQVKNAVPFINVDLQQHSFQLEIDTGSNGGLRIPPDLAQSLEWKAEPRPGSLVAVVGEAEREWTGRLIGVLALGAVRQPEPTVSVSDGGPSLGVGFLKNFCVVFDQVKERMWLCAGTDATVSAPPERTVGLSLLADATGWRVAGIIPGSPAEKANIVPGDVVTKIEGEPAHTWSRDRMQSWINTHDAVALQLTDSVGARDLALQVWSLVP